MKRRRSAPENYLPLLYFVVAAALVVVLLPSTLRPPTQQPNQTAELSPDAPPDENAPALVSSFTQAQSGVEGSGTSPGGAAGGGDGPGAAPVAAAPGGARACPHGFGNPPRQAASVYAPPCAAGFQGDNGGATAKGVTATEVRVAVIAQDSGTEGPVSDTPQPGESAKVKALRVMQTYFNSRFQLWGRSLRLVNINRTNAATACEYTRSDVQDAASYNVFAGTVVHPCGVREYARLGIVGWQSYYNQLMSRDFYTQASPLAYSWSMDGTRAMALASEYMCDKLKDRTARFAGDADLKTKKRVFGMLTWVNEEERAGEELIVDYEARCDGKLDGIVRFDLSTGPQHYATAMAQFKARGVTTIVYAADVISLTGFTNAADRADYHPEWFLTGTGIQDQTSSVHTFGYPSSQWSHVFGLSAKEMSRPAEDQDWAAAYREIDPAGAGGRPPAVLDEQFSTLMQVVAGIQLAGPRLTPASYRKGLYEAPSKPADPVWSVGGGFGPSDPTYTDDVVEIWWDAEADDPDGDLPGAYRYVDGGRRYRPGEIPEGESKVFADGVLGPDG